MASVAPHLHDAGRHPPADWSTLMARAQDGDALAYRAMLESITPYVRAIASRAHRNPSDAEDTVQDVLLTLHAVRHTDDRTRPFKPWLAGIARYRVADRMRVLGRALAREVALNPWHEGLPAEAPGAPVLLDPAVLQAALDALPGVLAAAACLVASLPDRSRRWLWLPALPAAVWVSTLSYGCLADWVSLDPASVEWRDELHCLSTLLLTSVPLSLGLFVLLRHAARLRPAPVTMTAGLAVSAITSATMSVIHQIDASAMVLAWNLGFAAILVAFDAAVGRWVLSRLAPSVEL